MFCQVVSGRARQTGSVGKRAGFVWNSGQPEAPARTPDTIPGAPPAPPAGGQTISGVGRERTLLGVAPVPAASAEQAAQPGAPATLTGGAHRTLTGVDGAAPLDQTIMGTFAAVPSLTRTPPSRTCITWPSLRWSAGPIRRFQTPSGATRPWTFGWWR